jgi:hypothetical protein
VVTVTKQEVLKNAELLSDFKTCVSSRSDAVDTAAVTRVYLELVRRVITRWANSFPSILERFANNKGIDAQMSFRNKRKAYASDTQSKI